MTARVAIAVTAAALTALATPALAAPRNCGELLRGAGGPIAYLRTGGPVAGSVEVFVCNADYACDPVLALHASERLAVGWDGPRLVIAADTDALPVIPNTPQSGKPLPPVEIVGWTARNSRKVERWLEFAQDKCTLPRPIG
jgi:hypothetical protein